MVIKRHSVPPHTLSYLLQLQKKSVNILTMQNYLVAIFFWLHKTQNGHGLAKHHP